ncbi:hypothetical protein WJX72_010597 [[Myrmecia] bisecta]|uniref:Uncharacterized protein n=1 Tax=[Myrmecia] bisecta TaxID=41462 RepID=A0AAW1Q9V3_9CHLO
MGPLPKGCHTFGRRKLPKQCKCDELEQRFSQWPWGQEACRSWWQYFLCAGRGKPKRKSPDQQVSAYGFSYRDNLSSTQGALGSLEQPLILPPLPALSKITEDSEEAESLSARQQRAANRC